MFDPKKPNIAYMESEWENIKRGALMRLVLDTETYGFSRTDVPYATPAYPGISEYGDALLDISYNYLNSARIFPRRPPWLLPQASAIILQRLPNGPADFDSPERPDYMTAMASIAWRIEQAAFAYDQFGGEKQMVSITDYIKHGSKKAVESVIHIPLLDENGEVCYPARYHHERRMLAYRFDRNPKSKYYSAEDNLYYVDEEEKTLWKWVHPSLNIYIHNAPYDNPVIITNLYRSGFDPQDTTLLYARAAPGSKQNPRNYLIDSRHMIHAAATYGRQTEDSVKLGQLLDPVTNKVRTSEALAAFLESSSRQHNPIRFVRGGPFMADNGSKHDKALDHGAVYDALGTAAALALSSQREPKICGMVDAQANEDYRSRNVLVAHSPDEKKLPLFSLPRREGGHDYSESPYWYLGNDDQAGAFKTHLFLLADGSLHKEQYKGKALHELSADEWKLYFKSAEGKSSPDRIFRKEKLRYMPFVMPLDKVLTETSQASRYRTQIPEMKLDLKYIGEHPEMPEKIIHALADINHARRFEGALPQIPLMEDELPQQYGNIAYQQELDDIIRRRAVIEGPRALPLLAETLKNGMNNTYDFMRQIDRAGHKLCLRAHIIDGFNGVSLRDNIHLKDDYARQALVDFTAICEAQYTNVFRKKECGYKEILDQMKKPNGMPYFVKGKFKAETVGEALHFRTQLGLRALHDYERALKLGKSAYIDGFADKNFCNQHWRDKRLFLFADPDSGEKGAAPHVVDSAGRQLPLSYLLSVDPKDAMRKLVDKHEWDYRFYRLRSEPTILRLAHRFVLLGMEEKLPPGVRMLYEADLQRRLHGFPNETETTARIPNLLTIKHEITRLKAAATSRDEATLARDPNPRLTEAFQVLKNDEGPRLLEACDKYIRQIAKQHPVQKDMWQSAAYDPKSGLPFDYIPYAIDRDPAVPLEKDRNFLLVDVPLWHAHSPIEQLDTDLPHRGLVIPALDKNKRESVNRRGKPLLVRIPETGQIYATGIATIHPLPPNEQTTRFANLVSRAQNDYAQASQEITGRKIDYVGIEALYDVAGTRPDIDNGAQAVKLPNVQFYGLVAPQFVALDTPVIAVVMPADYLPQKLTPGAPILLSQMKADSYANFKGTQEPETGHTYQSILRQVVGEARQGKQRGIPISQLMRLVEGKGSDELKAMVYGAGIDGPDHLRKLLAGWTTEAWKGDPDQQRMMIFSFDPVSPDSWFLRKLTGAPMAGFRFDGQPIPPSLYRSSPPSLLSSPNSV